MKASKRPRGFAVRLPPKGSRGGGAGDGESELTPLQRLQAEEEERRRFAEEYERRLEEEERERKKEEDMKARGGSSSSSSSPSSAPRSRRLRRPLRPSFVQRPRVFLEVELRHKPRTEGEEGALDFRGRMDFELFADLAPRAAENFRQLCTGESAAGLHYRGCPFHRIVPGFGAQGGDAARGDGTGICSIYGGVFPDESFVERHAGPGVLTMVNSGPHTNGCQFLLLFRAQPQLDGRHVVFGRLLADPAGLLARIESVGTPEGVPVRSVRISACGEVPVLGWGPAVGWTGPSPPRNGAKRGRSASSTSTASSPSSKPSSSSSSSSTSSSSSSSSRARRKKKRKKKR
mmetsp:Transcript_7684/g.24050  ORF Transcript_7684/g.24050 Transcript_7684/m.24050 type:complete len:346 (+) Transcript_7684:1-1038(+)